MHLVGRTFLARLTIGMVMITDRPLQNNWKDQWMYQILAVFTVMTTERFCCRDLKKLFDYISLARLFEAVLTKHRVS